MQGNFLLLGKMQTTVGMITWKGLHGGHVYFGLCNLVIPIFKMKLKSCYFLSEC